MFLKRLHTKNNVTIQERTIEGVDELVRMRTLKGIKSEGGQEIYIKSWTEERS